VITLVLGGTRSGKSEVAERLAASAGDRVTFVATADPGADGSFAARVAAHRLRRPSGWVTVEAAGADLAALVASTPGTVLVDSLGTWLVGASGFARDVDALCDALANRSDHAIVVSEEVGLGVHPPTAVGVAFADALGVCNRRVAQVAHRVLLVVAGRCLELGRPD
jgi:adenosylcobinamide kinase/adenosylcobinamide-phosphate guanylyltransferase